jgi:hypothetical protein
MSQADGGHGTRGKDDRGTLNPLAGQRRRQYHNSEQPENGDKQGEDQRHLRKWAGSATGCRRRAPTAKMRCIWNPSTFLVENVDGRQLPRTSLEHLETRADHKARDEDLLVAFIER